MSTCRVSLACVVAALVAGGCASTRNGEAEQGRWDRTRLKVALQLAEEQIANGKLDRARALLVGFSAGAEPGRYGAEAYRLELARARIDVEQGAYAAALKRLEALAPRADDSAQYHCLRGVASEGLGRWAEAATAYERAYVLGPTADRLIAWLDALLLDDRATEANETLRRERRGFPGDAALHAAAARLYARLGDARATATELRAALLSEPESPELRRKLAQACTAAGDYGEAAPLWRELVTASTNDEQRHHLRHQLAACLLAADRYSEATGIYRTLTLIRPDDAEAHVGLAAAALADGQPALALQAAGRALALDPTHAEARQITTLSHARLGEAQRAAEEWSHLPPNQHERPLVREKHAR